MLLVKTRIGSSKIHGIGLFAAENILKGTIIWNFSSKFDQKFSINQINKLPWIAKQQFLNYAYRSNKNNYILCCDDARFLNHSNDPNTIDDNEEEGMVLAARNITEGEEITTNYMTFDSDFERKLGMIAISPIQ